jgi:hypothetical protein
MERHAREKIAIQTQAARKAILWSTIAAAVQLSCIIYFVIVQLVTDIQPLTMVLLALVTASFALSLTIIVSTLIRQERATAEKKVARLTLYGHGIAVAVGLFMLYGVATRIGNIVAEGLTLRNTVQVSMVGITAFGYLVAYAIIIRLYLRILHSDL